MDPAVLDLSPVLEVGGRPVNEEFRRYLADKIAPRAMGGALSMSQIGG
jgi:hypothetical protein